jgi:hypothetical protein
LDGLIIFNTWGRPIQRHGHIFNVIHIGRIKTTIRKIKKEKMEEYDHEMKMLCHW